MRAGVGVEKRTISPSYHHVVSLSPDRKSSIDEKSAVKADSMYSTNGAIDFKDACAPSAGIGPTAASAIPNALRYVTCVANLWPKCL